MISRRNTLKLGAAMSALGLSSISFQAVARDGQLVTFVVGFPAGGSPDILARNIAEMLHKSGWDAIVENRTGASGRISVDYVRRAGSSDSVVLITPIEILTLLPHVYEDIRYD